MQCVEQSQQLNWETKFKEHSEHHGHVQNKHQRNHSDLTESNARCFSTDL